MPVPKKLFEAKIGAEIRGYIKGTLTYKEVAVTIIMDYLVRNIMDIKKTDSSF
ncbi:hypothetical protein [Pedobacter steynii]|uniref:hypothetical protein n=1 Tax=Pedobacter steynii TaxID=430522 RepID=UPI0012FC5549|nr:hypothetical protein [Pedobacter steynii]